MLSDQQIQELLASNRREPEAACRALVHEANRYGGEDNVTVVVACVSDTA
jgi:serine/threonine protein phosphatase PrpC